MNKVKVVADEFGNVIRVSEKNPEFSHIRVEQDVITFNKAWVVKKTRTALIHGKTVELKDLVSSTGMKAGYELEGRIIVKESLEPFSKENPERDIKYAGNTGVPCLFEDQIIYRTSYFTSSKFDEDELIPHTNVNEIREASAKALMTAEKEFEDEVVKPVSPSKTVKNQTSELEIEVEDTVEKDEVAFDF